MNINLEVTYKDGTSKTVSAGASEIVAFEAKFDISMARLEKEVRLTHLLWLAWVVEKNAGEKLDFDGWLKTVDMVAAADQKK